MYECLNKNMKALKVKPIKVPSSYVHPEPPNEALPRHEFTLGLIGNTITNLLAPKGGLANFYFSGKDDSDL